MWPAGPNAIDPERWRVRTAWYLVLIAFTIAYLSYNFRLHRADLRAPLCPAHNDSAALLSLVTAIQESGWPWQVDRLGAPGVAERYDYPLPEHAHYLAIRSLLLVTGNSFMAFNLWCLLSYPITAVCSFAVMRALGVSRPSAFALSAIYTFLPYHAGRVFSHTMLAYYHTVPLILLPTIWICAGRLPFFSPIDEHGRRRLSVWNATTGWTLLCTTLTAATSPYYAFFGCIFLLVAGLYRALSEAAWRPLLGGMMTAFLVSAIGFACALPFMLQQRAHGANPAVAQRHANEADVYSLKFTTLVLPFGGHRIGSVGHISRLYHAEALYSNENRDAVLGVVGVAGMVILLGRLLMARTGPTLLGGLAVLNVAALIVGATGGLGGLFNFLVFPQMRCYNRVCVFIAFWCLLAVGLLIDRWAARGHQRRYWLAAACVLVIGLLDITSTRQAPHHSQLQRNHDAWSGFVQRMESALPTGAMVFQLPAASYPEAGTLQHMPDYAHLACHSYSRALRWSYGTCRNRRWDEWHQHVARLIPVQMIRALCLADFDGVYVDRRGYPDNGKALLAELRAHLGREVVVSDSGDQLLFALTARKQAWRSAVAVGNWEAEKSRLLNRPYFMCQEGFLRWAPTSLPEPRRATHAASIRLVNPDQITRQITLTIGWQRQTAHEVEVHLCCTSLAIDRHERPPMERSILAIPIKLPPGEHVLRFESTPTPLGWQRMYTAWNAAELRLDTCD